MATAFCGPTTLEMGCHGRPSEKQAPKKPKRRGEKGKARTHPSERVGHPQNQNKKQIPRASALVMTAVSHRKFCRAQAGNGPTRKEHVWGTRKSKTQRRAPGPRNFLRMRALCAGGGRPGLQKRNPPFRKGGAP